ncbi:SDR family oxidoreductase [Actinomadura darangshiensis]|uniref:SDR family oxidoreductase n=1 Tax=Actinomadura darangshiensis TaxID=705336 RepID=A0A4R5C4N4_9ACTN|nr:SDR family oxidoreductase [Actinomadura darangshiensis]TDD92930.1 SDR family oxidoreductase [Actinomadura darangshiensis]
MSDNATAGHDRTRTGRVALVTGASSGIGAAIARRLAGSGAHVVIADLDEKQGSALAGQIGGAFHKTDVSVLADNEAAVEAAVQRFGRLDVVHLNAGICGGTELDPEQYRRTLSVNLDGVFYGVCAAVPQLQRQGGGTIVVTASIAGLIGLPYDPIYTISKHGLIGLVRSLGPALAPAGISINALCPNFVDTPLIAEDRPFLDEAGIELLDTGHVADAFESVLSDDRTGRAWLVQAGHKPAPYDFAPVPDLPAALDFS